MAVRGAVLFAVAALMLVWVLSAHGNWRDGAFSGPINFGNLLLAGSAGRRYIRPAVSGLADAIPGTARQQTKIALEHFLQTVANGFYRPFYLFLILAGGSLAALFLKSLESEVFRPRHLQIRAVKVLARALTGMALGALVFYAAAYVVFHSVNRPHYQADTLTAFTAAHWTSLVAIMLIGLAWIPSAFVSQADVAGSD